MITKVDKWLDERYTILMVIKTRIIFEQIAPFIESREAIVITGMRQTGKTTVLRWLYERVSSENKIFLDLENPLNRKYFEEENYEVVRKTLESLGIDFGQRAYVFIDEIQFVRRLPSVVKYLLDHYGVKFFLTGSASFYLKNLFTESLSGRKCLFELFPLSFQEFLVFREIPIHGSGDILRSRVFYETVLPFCEEYLQFGGFPGVVLKSSVEEKRKALEDIYTSFFQMEVGQLADFRKNEVVRDLILLLSTRVGSKVDFQKLSTELGVARSTVKEYVDFLQGTYFVELLRPFHRRKDTEIRKAPKVYLCDCGLLRYLGTVEEGKIFENAVFQNLRLQGQLHYYQKKTGVEIDFLLNGKQAYEVKTLPQKTDWHRLQMLARELGLTEYQIVSRKYVDMEGVSYLFHL